MAAHMPMTFHLDSHPDRRPACRHRIALGPHTVPAAATPLSDDELLLLLLTSTWELRTGRPTMVTRPADMTEEELIEYWSDPINSP